MLNKLRQKLTLLFLTVTGGILTAVIIIIFIFMKNQTVINNQMNFQKEFNNVVYKLQSESVLSDTWLSVAETQNLFVIYIEDNGTPIFFKGSWLSDTERLHVLDQIYSLEEQIVSADEMSKVYRLNSHDNIRCYGSSRDIKSGGTTKKLTMIQYFPDERKSVFNQGMLLFIIYISAMAALGPAIWILVGKAIKPISESQRKQTEFTAAASHELRSPLTVIRTAASALKTDPDRSEQFLPVIEKECVRMSGLIQDMLVLASSDAKTWNVSKEAIETDTFLISLYESFSPVCIQKSHCLSLSLPDAAMPFILGDSERLHQALVILLDNAIEYSPAGSAILLSGYTMKNSVFLEVQDHGCGIPQEDKTRIFDRFYRADKSRSNKSHFGLGLSIANELVSLHSGKLTVKDTPGGGATFVIQLKILD